MCSILFCIYPVTGALFLLFATGYFTADIGSNFPAYALALYGRGPYIAAIVITRTDRPPIYFPV